MLGLGGQAFAGPIRLARHPDYHAGRVAFSYLGDIWTANEDGTAIQRITDNVAREVYPRFSPDGTLDRVLVEPLRQLRRLRRPGGRRHARAPHLPHRQRRGRRMDARFAAGHLPMRRAATARSRASRCSIRCR